MEEYEDLNSTFSFWTGSREQPSILLNLSWYITRLGEEHVRPALIIYTVLAARRGHGLFSLSLIVFLSLQRRPTVWSGLPHAKMGLKHSLASLMLAVPLALAHGIHDNTPLGPIERRDLNHCDKAFKEEEFMKPTVEIHGREFARLRRNLGLDTEEMDRYERTEGGACHRRP